MKIWDRFRTWLARDLIAVKEGRLIDMTASRDRGLTRLRGIESGSHLTLGPLVQNEVLESGDGPSLAYLRDAAGRTCLIEMPEGCRGIMIGKLSLELGRALAMQNVAGESPYGRMGLLWDHGLLGGGRQ